MPAQAERRQRAALEWIVRAAAGHSLPYQVVGGLAALAHGGSRPLHDIDLSMPFGDPRWPDFPTEVKPYVVWGPASVVEGAWDLTYLKIDHNGQRIEIGDPADLRIRDADTSEWIDQVIDFGSSLSRTVLGCEVDVMPVDQLVDYKRILGLDVDRQDFRELTSARS